MGNGKRLYSIALALSVLIFFFLNSISSVASAKEITVNDDFEADFLSIQEAVNSSSAGDVVLVSPGIYNESVDINTQNISVLSDSGDPEDTVVRDFKLSVNNITVSGFSIQEGLNLQGYKLPNNFNYYRVENCTVKNNRFLEQGIHATECYNSTIAKNVFLGNESGITVEGDNSTISDNIVVDGSISTSLISRYSILINNTLLNGGIGLGGYRNKLIGNNISCTEGECGICLSESSSNIIDNNSVSSAYYGIMMPFFCGDNQITNNTLTSNAVGILIAHYSSGSVIKNNTISNNSIGISLDDYALVTGNRIELNKECGIYLEHSGDVDGCSGDGLIYNNFFNNTVNLFNSTGVFDSSDVADSAVLNTTKTPGINIVGGPYQGGNFWAKPDGTGFSQICADADGDGIGDLPYNINGSEIDYLPLVSVSRSQESIIPVANFSTNITQNLAPVSVQFTDFSKNAVAWNWDFDNDEISDSINQNPAYLYTTSGTYIVNLTVSNGKDTSSKNMKIIVKKAEVPPVAEFKTNITNGQVPLSVQFTDLSKNATSRSWDFNNDGISDSIEKNPVYVYTYPGAYTVNLTVNNTKGTVLKSLTIEVSPAQRLDGKLMLTEFQITTNESRQEEPAIYGDRIVWQDYRNGDYTLYLYNISTSLETPIFSNYPQFDPAIYDDRVVWQESGDIYLYNLSTSTKDPTTNKSGTYPDIYDNKIVWQNSQIYIRDLSTFTTARITNNTSHQEYPAIHGDRIVWQEWRNQNWDIYMCDLSTKKETQITVNESDQLRPDIYGDRIVWQDSRNEYPNIYMYNLSSSREIRITSNKSGQYWPAIYGDKIVWEDGRNGSNIYMYDLSTKKEIRITTSGSASSPEIYGNMIVWQDGRNGNADIYMCTVSVKEPTLPLADFNISRN